MKKHGGFKVWLTMGALMFGTYCGGGTAAGTYATGYYLKSGGGHLLPLVAIFMLSMFIGCGLSLNAIRAYKTYNYRDYVLALYALDKPDSNPILQRIVTIFFDLFALFTFVMNGGACIALTAELLNVAFKLPAWIGGILASVLFIILAVRGVGFLRKFNGAMTIGILACLIIILFAVIGIRGDLLAERFGNFSIGTDWAGETVGQVYKGLLMFCVGSSFSWGLVLNSFAKPVITKKDAYMSALFIGIMTGSLFILTGAIVLPFLPEYMKIGAPILQICTNYLTPFIVVLYWVIILFSVTSSAAPMAYNLANRYMGSWKSESVKPGTKLIILLIIMFAISYFISSFGLMAIISKGFQIMGMIGIPACGIPLIISIFRIRKKDRLEKEVAEA